MRMRRRSGALKFPLIRIAPAFIYGVIKDVFGNLTLDFIRAYENVKMKASLILVAIVTSATTLILRETLGFPAFIYCIYTVTLDQSTFGNFRRELRLFVKPRKYVYWKIVLLFSKSFLWENFIFVFKDGLFGEKCINDNWIKSPNSKNNVIFAFCWKIWWKNDRVGVPTDNWMKSK